MFWAKSSFFIFNLCKDLYSRLNKSLICVASIFLVYKIGLKTTFNFAFVDNNHMAKSGVESEKNTSHSFTYKYNVLIHQTHPMIYSWFDINKHTHEMKSLFLSTLTKRDNFRHEYHDI